MLQIFQVSTIFIEAIYLSHAPKFLRYLTVPSLLSLPPSQGCVLIENLNLSHVKASDRGINLLLHSPLTSLSTLNLSHTRITSSSLSALPRGLLYPSPFPSLLPPSFPPLSLLLPPTCFPLLSPFLFPSSLNSLLHSLPPRHIRTL